MYLPGAIRTTPSPSEDKMNRPAIEGETVLQGVFFSLGAAMEHGLKIIRGNGCEAVIGYDREEMMFWAVGRGEYSEDLHGPALVILRSPEAEG